MPDVRGLRGECVLQLWEGSFVNTVPRDFTWCPQEVAERCDQERAHVHIVIASPKAIKRINLPCRKTTLRLFFYDLDPEAIRRTNAYANDPAKGQELIDGCFTEEHAGHIALFVESTAPDDVIVNCEAGISRSPGVVLALRRKYGGDTEWVYKRSCPNIHVASLLGKVLGVGPFQPKELPKSEGGLFLVED